MIKELFERLPWRPGFGVSHICLNLMDIMENDVDGEYLEDTLKDIVPPKVIIVKQSDSSPPQ